MPITAAASTLAGMAAVHIHLAPIIGFVVHGFAVVMFEADTNIEGFSNSSGHSSRFKQLCGVLLKDFEHCILVSNKHPKLERTEHSEHSLLP